MWRFGATVWGGSARGGGGPAVYGAKASRTKGVWRCRGGLRWCRRKGCGGGRVQDSRRASGFVSEADWVSEGGWWKKKQKKTRQ